jgi:hypothetical protein
MGFIDILKKLGILSCEAKAATYTNAKDRPKELMQGIDIEHDLRASENSTTAPED